MKCRINAMRIFYSVHGLALNLAGTFLFNSPRFQVLQMSMHLRRRIHIFNMTIAKKNAPVQRIVITDIAKRIDN
ncbi:MAG: hypothetical protein HRT88_10695 [Lentisphaeraceae bacterium]|nr:hypothetical protein [Lentisphaeraceae bacterium]